MHLDTCLMGYHTTVPSLCFFFGALACTLPLQWSYDTAEKFARKQVNDSTYMGHYYFSSGLCVACYWQISLATMTLLKGESIWLLVQLISIFILVTHMNTERVQNINIEAAHQYRIIQDSIAFTTDRTFYCRFFTV